VLFLSSRQKRAPRSGLAPSLSWRYAQKPVGLEKKRLEKKHWDLHEAVLAAVILASGVWMIIAGLTKLWGE
jgi:hypothetical protein